MKSFEEPPVVESTPEELTSSEQAEAFSDVNKYFAWEKLGHSPSDEEAIEHYKNNSPTYQERMRESVDSKMDEEIEEQLDDVLPEEIPVVKNEAKEIDVLRAKREELLKQKGAVLESMSAFALGTPERRAAQAELDSLREEIKDTDKEITSVAYRGSRIENQPVIKSDIVETAPNPVEPANDGVDIADTVWGGINDNVAEEGIAPFTDKSEDIPVEEKALVQPAQSSSAQPSIIERTKSFFEKVGTLTKSFFGGAVEKIPKIKEKVTSAFTLTKEETQEAVVKNVDKKIEKPQPAHSTQPAVKIESSLESSPESVIEIKNQAVLDIIKKRDSEMTDYFTNRLAQKPHELNEYNYLHAMLKRLGRKGSLYVQMLHDEIKFEVEPGTDNHMFTMDEDAYTKAHERLKEIISQAENEPIVKNIESSVPMSAHYEDKILDERVTTKEALVEKLINKDLELQKDVDEVLPQFRHTHRVKTELVPQSRREAAASRKKYLAEKMEHINTDPFKVVIEKSVEKKVRKPRAVKNPKESSTEVKKRITKKIASGLQGDGI